MFKRIFRYFFLFALFKNAIASSQDINKKDYFDEIIMSQDSFKVMPSQNNLRELHTATTLVISCVDFRLRDETTKLFDDIFKMQDDYDEVALPGASLSYVVDEFPEWNTTVSNIITILKKLHSIKRIVFLDHYECGAYKMVKGKQHTYNREDDLKMHQEVMIQASNKLKKEFPDLKVYGLMMDLNGHVDKVF